MAFGETCAVVLGQTSSHCIHQIGSVWFNKINNTQFHETFAVPVALSAHYRVLQPICSLSGSIDSAGDVKMTAKTVSAAYSCQLVSRPNFFLQDNGGYQNDELLITNSTVKA